MSSNKDKSSIRGGGIRNKLIAIFIVIKVLPLIALAIFAAHQIDFLGNTVKQKSEEMVEDTKVLVSQVGSLATESSIKALDLKARESIERLTTETALAVADFLYERDRDILFAASLPVDKSNYENFLTQRKGEVIFHKAWRLSEDGTQWLPPDKPADDLPLVRPVTPDNKKDFHYRRPNQTAKPTHLPLYHEMTFFDLDGTERIKVSSTDLLNKELKDVSNRQNTWCRGEDYFDKIKDLEPGEIYVSDVIGPYISSPIIGPFTKQTAAKKNIPFVPEQAGYAGKENPVGKRFEGIIRWITPVFESGEKVGYVSLALDHTHLMEFTDHLIPTPERYTDISDASSGNYAFMWDSVGRNISHPRDYFIVGYDPEKGEQAVPWLSVEMYDLWIALDRDFSKFQQVAPQFRGQSLERKPAGPLTAAGMLALDCRYLNFAPQCSGWNNLTQYGGSGSFVIFWSKLWKLTTAATIPYYTGKYKNSPRGFGFVTIGANVDEFHRSATKTAERINTIAAGYEDDLQQKKENTLGLIDGLLSKTIENLTVSTMVMIILVILVAIWMASVFTQKITTIIKGIKKFQEGQLTNRIPVTTSDELGQLASAFNEMSDSLQDSMGKIRRAMEKAEESDKAKSLFLANMSHEIRTPMNAIIGMSRLAFEMSKDEDQQKLLESVKISADSLLAVVNDILDFSKVEAGQLDLESYSFFLRTVIKNAVNSVSLLAENKNLELSCRLSANLPKTVIGDQMRLRQVLLNLLGNAVKFTRRGSVILEVGSRKLSERKVEVEFVLRDTGVGIAPENLELIFDRFSQSDLSIIRKHQGTGLGLAISREICRLMGGEIKVESEQGQGSTFIFTAIFETPEKEPVVKDDRTRGQVDNFAQPLTILVVEDNEPNSELARMVLEQEGHQVRCVFNGFQALQAMTEADFDVVLMDIQMPEMDGYTAARIIRRCESGAEVEEIIPASLAAGLKKRLLGDHQPIIALTAHAMRGDKEKCLAAGMDEYLTKPFMPHQVMAVLQKHVGSFFQEEGNKNEIVKDETRPLLAFVKFKLQQAYQLDDAKIDALVVTTVSNLKEAMAQLKRAIEDGDRQRTQETAHSIKGMLLNIRLPEQAACAEKLQHERNLITTREQLQLYEKLLDSVMELVDSEDAASGISAGGKT